MMTTICQQCRKPAMSGTTYCSFCGAPFTTGSATPTPAIIDSSSNPPGTTSSGTLSLSTALTYLTWAFAAYIVGFASVIVGPLMGRHVPDGVFQILALCMIVGMLGFHIVLGIMAARLQRSLVLWVGATFITMPIGPIVAYINMRSLVMKHTP